MKQCYINKEIIRYGIGLCLLCIIILYPQVAYSLCQDSFSVSYIFTGLIFLLPVIAFAMLLPRKWLYCILTIICTIISIIELTMVDLFSGYLQPGGILSTIMTNPQEASEFYDTNLHEVWKWIPLIVLCLASCWCFKRVGIKKWKYGFASSFILIPMLFITYKLTIFYHDDPLTIRFYLDNRVWNRPPYNVIYASMGAYRILEQRKMIEQAANVNFGAHRDSIPSKKEIYVFAVGESLRYRNVSLNGEYPRSTTPRLEALDNLMLFDNYYSQACFTMLSVPMLVTRATPVNYEINYAERSIVEPFTEAGFRTYVIVNTNLLSYEKYLSAGCDSLIIVPQDADGRNIKSGDNSFVNIIDSLANIHEKLFVMCQFYGNHAFFTNYDVSCDVYHPNINDAGVSRSLETMINAYDNSILYTDYVLSSIIETINRPNTISAFMFVSDHGEDVRWDSAGHGGNCAPIKDEYHVPFIFWWSDDYAEQYPDKIHYALTHKAAKLNGDVMFYSLCGMADIQLDSIYTHTHTHTWNVLSSEFQEHERLVMLPDGVNMLNPDKY